MHTAHQLQKTDPDVVLTIHPQDIKNQAKIPILHPHVPQSSKNQKQSTVCTTTYVGYSTDDIKTQNLLMLIIETRKTYLHNL